MSVGTCTRTSRTAQLCEEQPLRTSSPTPYCPFVAAHAPGPGISLPLVSFLAATAQHCPPRCMSTSTIHARPPHCCVPRPPRAPLAAAASRVAAARCPAAPPAQSCPRRRWPARPTPAAPCQSRRPSSASRPACPRTCRGEDKCPPRDSVKTSPSRRIRCGPALSHCISIAASSCRVRAPCGSPCMSTERSSETVPPSLRFFSRNETISRDGSSTCT